MNPLMRLVQIVRSGGNPENLLRQMAQQNPLVAQTMKMVEGKSPQQINQIAANMAREKGVDYNVFAQQIRQTLGL